MPLRLNAPYRLEGAARARRIASQMHDEETRAMTRRLAEDDERLAGHVQALEAKLHPARRRPARHPPGPRPAATFGLSFAQHTR